MSNQVSRPDSYEHAVKIAKHKGVISEAGPVDSWEGKIVGAIESGFRSGLSKEHEDLLKQLDYAKGLLTEAVDVMRASDAEASCEKFGAIIGIIEKALYNE